MPPWFPSPSVYLPYALVFRATDYDGGLTEGEDALPVLFLRCSGSRGRL